MRKDTLKRLLSYLRPYKTQVVLALLCAFASVLLSLLGPVFIGRAIDAMLGPGRVQFAPIVRVLSLAGVAIALSAVAGWGMQVLTRCLSAKASQDIRRQVFTRLNEVPLRKLDRRRHGELASRLVNDADAVAEGLMQGLGQLFPGLVTILATIGVMLVLNWVIALVVILITPLSILFAQFVGRRTARFFRSMSNAQGATSGFVGEMVEGRRVLQDLGYEQEAGRQFDRLNADYTREYRRAVLYSSFINPGTRFVNAIVFGAVAVLGGIYAIHGGITVGGLSVFLNYANQYTKPFNEVTAVLTQVQTAFASVERLFEVIDWTPETPDAKGALAPSHSEGYVKAEEVCFSYNKEIPFIRSFSFATQPGTRIALVGPTGCGKTTIINLLMRFYEVDAGSITVDGQEIRTVRRDALRSLYGMVLQDSWLKQATVRDNIAYANPGASDDEVVEAAKKALAHGFIKRLPQGYDTVLARGGEDLSAGEKQLLCIARIMLAKPDMLILDEATSSIDTRTELLIQKAMERLMVGRTSFVVAHRLSTIQNADEILVMDAGQIVERGRHEELLEKGGFYAGLYNSQFGGV
ncbi:ABC transporter ATP-binding protein/permease [Ruminococcaceae bacterium OttesenSCG-928-I18]|nr:ABC transporter ATP-binding protein/permease [Ruminococcaceae bacterium OttesenSCG-928-I18]